MVEIGEDYDAWIDVVLRQNRRPFWLSGDAPESDVVLSSRARLTRNLAGYPFPHRCTRRQLEEVQGAVRYAAAGLDLEERKSVSEAERAVLAGSRLCSPEFEWNDPGRSLFLDSERSVAVMVNEEDHLRIQAVTPGLSVQAALGLALGIGTALKCGGQARPSESHPSRSGEADKESCACTQHPTFAHSHEFGYLSASVDNSGDGRRLGAMLHLPGLAEQGLLQVQLEVLEGEGVVARGLMGEMSTGVGAYVQLSSTRLNSRELSGPLNHLLDIERTARARAGAENLKARVSAAKRRIDSGAGMSLSQAVNACSWLRFGAVLGEFDRKPRDLDAMLALLTFGHHDEPMTNLRRRRLAARFLSLTLPWSGD